MRISDMMDAIEDDTVPIMEKEIIASERIMEATMAKIHVKKEKHYSLKKRLVSVALAAVLILALGVTAYAIYNWRLQDLVLHSNTENETEIAESQSYDPLPADVDTLSLQGYAGSPEYMAMLEWSEFRKNYDRDGAILAAVGNDPTPWDEKYNFNGYGIYSQEMADTIDAIAEEYGLSLHSGGMHFTNTMAELYEQFGNFCPAENDYGYYFDDGTFQCDCVVNGLSFQLRRCMKGTMDGVGLNVNDVEQFERWEYQTSSGVTVLLAMGPSKALIIADLPDSFVVVSINDSLQPRPGESIFSKQEIESLADSIDFSIL